MFCLTLNIIIEVLLMYKMNTDAFFHGFVWFGPRFYRNFAVARSEQIASMEI